MSSIPRTQREPKETDFTVQLDGVGLFRYGQRTYGDRLRIRAYYLGLLGATSETDEAKVHPDLKMRAGVIATHRVLCVDAPDGWDDLENLNLLKFKNASEVDQHVMDLLIALNEKEDSFRPGQAPVGEIQGA